LEQSVSAVPANREKHEAVTGQLNALMLNILLFQKACDEIAEVQPPVIAEAGEREGGECWVEGREGSTAARETFRKNHNA